MKVSVVITTYNRPEYLALSLASALKQDTPAMEIIIIDDNSTVDYNNMLKQFDKQYFTYLKQSFTGGANVARNRGIEEATGDVVAFLDDDDIWLPSYLTCHVHAYEDGAGAVVSGFKHLGNEKVVRVNSDTEVSKASLVRGNHYCGMSGFSCKKAILQDLNFDETLNNGQDWDMYVRLYEQKVCFKNINKPIFLYRFQNLDGIGAKLRKMNPDNIEQRIGSARKHRAFLGEYRYKQRVAEQLLVSLRYKQNKLNWILKSLEVIGILATLMYFLRKVTSKIVFN